MPEQTTTTPAEKQPETIPYAGRNSGRRCPAPQAGPQYFKNRSSTVWELDFNDSNQVTLSGYDDAHILIQRCERIPLDFYEVATRKSPTLAAILDSADPVSEKCRAIKEFFGPILGKKMEQNAAVNKTASIPLRAAEWRPFFAERRTRSLQN